MPLIKCHSCGKSFDRPLKKNEHCPLCDGWAGNEIATASDSLKEHAAKPTPCSKIPGNSGTGLHPGCILMILAPIVVFVMGLWQGKGCDAAWKDAEMTALAILTRTRPTALPSEHVVAPRIDHNPPSHIDVAGPFPAPVTLPARDTVFALGDHVQTVVDVLGENGVRIPAMSTGIIASVGNEVVENQQYWVSWVQPYIATVSSINESDLLPDDGSGRADSAERADRISAEFRFPGRQNNPRRGFVWCRRAAQLGRAASMCDLGWMYSNGIGVAKDDVMAVSWYRRSADQGNAFAMNNLGIMCRDGCATAKDDSQAVLWFRKGADSGSALAMDNLGWMFQNGLGVDHDDVEAVKWFQKAADLQCDWGMIHLSFCYQNGRGVAQDRAAAISWLNKAVASGSATAMGALGDAYENGWGVPADSNQAIDWYRKAAVLGERRAQDLLIKRGLDWKPLTH